MMRWSKTVLDSEIAQGVSSFISAEIPDLRDQFPQSRYWLKNRFLNSALRHKFNGHWHQYSISLIRRSYSAFEIYHQARDLTLEYLRDNVPDNPLIAQYYELLERWEAFTLQVNMVFEILKKVGDGVFDPDDVSSAEYRIYHIANQIKHPINGFKKHKDHVVPLFLTNEGLHSFGLKLTFNEASEILSKVAEFADEIQDPLTFYDSIQSLKST